MQQILAIVGVIASLSTVTVALPRWEATRHNAVGFESTSEYQPTGYVNKYSTPYSSSKKTSSYYPELSKDVKNPSSEFSTYTDDDAFGEGELEAEGSDGYTNDRYVSSSASYQKKPYSYEQEDSVADDVYVNEEPAYDNEYSGGYKNVDNGAVAADEEEYSGEDNEEYAADDNEYSADDSEFSTDDAAGAFEDGVAGAYENVDDTAAYEESSDFADENADDNSYENGDDTTSYEDPTVSYENGDGLYENGDDTAVYEESNDVADEIAPAKYGRYSSGTDKYSFYPVKNSAAKSPIKASEYYPQQSRSYYN